MDRRASVQDQGSMRRKVWTPPYIRGFEDIGNVQDIDGQMFVISRNKRGVLKVYDGNRKKGKTLGYFESLRDMKRKHPRWTIRLY